MSTLQAQILRLEAEILADKVNLMKSKSLLTKRIAYLKTACIVPPILVGGFLLGYTLSPTNADPTKKASPRQEFPVVIIRWIKHFTQLLINLKYLSI